MHSPPSQQNTWGGEKSKCARHNHLCPRGPTKDEGKHEEHTQANTSSPRPPSKATLLPELPPSQCASLPSGSHRVLPTRPPRPVMPASVQGHLDATGKATSLLRTSLVPPVIRMHVCRDDGFPRLPRRAWNHVRKPRRGNTIKNGQVEPRLALKELALDGGCVRNAGVTCKQRAGFQAKVSRLRGVLPWAVASHQKNIQPQRETEYTRAKQRKNDKTWSARAA